MIRTVSQICNLIGVLSIEIMRAPNSTPIETGNVSVHGSASVIRSPHKQLTTKNMAYLLQRVNAEHINMKTNKIT